eukprot:2871868-Amphidinium_carterae.2
MTCAPSYPCLPILESLPQSQESKSLILDQEDLVLNVTMCIQTQGVGFGSPFPGLDYAHAPFGEDGARRVRCKTIPLQLDSTHPRRQRITALGFAMAAFESKKRESSLPWHRLLPLFFGITIGYSQRATVKSLCISATLNSIFCRIRVCCRQCHRLRQKP